VKRLVAAVLRADVVSDGHAIGAERVLQIPATRRETVRGRWG
jgi:hypothetical protein